MADYNSPEPISLKASEILFGPLYIGAILQTALFGFVLSHLINLRSSPTWRRAGRLTKLVCYGVVLVNTAYTSLVCHDIWYYGTLFDRSFASVALASLPQAIEPIVLSVIAFVVQITLSIRSSRIMKRPASRYIYLGLAGALSLFTFLAGIAVTASSVRWTTLTPDEWIPGVDLRMALMCWMWGAFVTDTIITLVYLYHLRRTLWGQNETSDSVCFVIGRVLIRSASYTTVFAAITAVLAQQFGDKNIYYDVPYASSMPLGSLYTLSLFTTLSVGDVVQRELGGHLAKFQDSHPSALCGVGESVNLSHKRGNTTSRGYPAEREGSRESEKAFEWASSGGSGGSKAEQLV